MEKHYLLFPLLSGNTGINKGRGFLLKKAAIAAVVLIGIIGVSIPAGNYKPETEGKQIVKHGYRAAQGSKEELYNDVLVSLLSPYTQKAVDDFYGRYLKELPGADPNLDDVVSVERSGIDGRLEFLIKLETMPYIGPHNSVGKDHITFRVNASGRVALEKFEHIESSSILPQLYPDTIKKWPPS